MDYQSNLGFTVGPPGVKEPNQFHDIHLIPNFPWPNPYVWWSKPKFHWLHHVTSHFCWSKNRIFVCPIMSKPCFDGPIPRFSWWNSQVLGTLSPHLPGHLPSQVLQALRPPQPSPRWLAVGRRSEKHLLPSVLSWGPGGSSMGRKQNLECGWATKPSCMLCHNVISCYIILYNVV